MFTGGSLKRWLGEQTPDLKCGMQFLKPKENDPLAATAMHEPQEKEFDTDDECEVSKETSKQSLVPCADSIPSNDTEGRGEKSKCTNESEGSKLAHLILKEKEGKDCELCIKSFQAPGKLISHYKTVHGLIFVDEFWGGCGGCIIWSYYKLE